MSTIKVFRNNLAKWLGYAFAGNRDVYEACGYKKHLTLEDYAAMFKRNGIAKRVCKAYPKATWREPPKVLDDTGTTEADCEINKEWLDLLERVPLMRDFKRADIMSQVYQYAIVYLGFEDGEDPSQPLRMDSQNLLVYTTVFNQIQISNITFNKDVQSERYGKPEYYHLKLETNEDKKQKSLKIHYTRTIHFAEHLEDSDIYSEPYLNAGFNYFEDVFKVMSCSGEAFWKNANKGIQWNVDPEAGLEQGDVDKLKEQAEEFEHNLRRNMVTTGITGTAFSNDIPDPSSNVMTSLKLIAGTYEIPLRILVGNEAGELASSQDENNWLDKVDERKENYAVPTILRPLIQVLISTQNLSNPVGQVAVTFEKSASMSPEVKAEVAVKKTAAIRNYTSSAGAETLVPPGEFRQMIDLDPNMPLIDYDDDLDENDPEVKAAFDDAQVNN